MYNDRVEEGLTRLAVGVVQEYDSSNCFIKSVEQRIVTDHVERSRVDLTMVSDLANE
jgi:hypothetical protein